MNNLKLLLGVIAGFGLGYWAYYQTSALPKGVVLAFAENTECPDGWKEYEPTKGRFIMGGDGERQSSPNGYYEIGPAFSAPDSFVVNPDKPGSPRGVPYIALRHCVSTAK